MMKRMWLGIFAAGLLNLGTAGATPLITDDEAKLPPPKGAIMANTRGILRGPKVEVISPNEAAHSPLRLQLKFETFGGARIDIESVKVLYLRTPNVDLTARVRPFIQAIRHRYAGCRTASGRISGEGRRQGQRRPSGQHQFHLEGFAVMPR